MGALGQYENKIETDRKNLARSKYILRKPLALSLEADKVECTKEIRELVDKIMEE